MSDEDRIRWDGMYRDGAYEERTHPTAFLSAHIDELPKGRTLDLACGAGRNAIFLAAHGCQVDAWDISAEGLSRARDRAEAQGLEITWRECDLEQVEILPASYDLIVQIRYVNRELMPQVIAALRPGGMYLCEQHLVSDRDVIGPSKASMWRFAPGELRTSVSDLDIRHYSEEHLEDPDGRLVALARVIAQRPD